MQNTYKIVSLLLDYPDEEVKENLPEMMNVMNREAVLSRELRSLVNDFILYASSQTLSEWQMHYVQLFDYSSRCNLYLFDHIYGDSRERGQAMVDLLDMYVKSGFALIEEQLPNYLPLFLEYLSLLTDQDKAGRLLQEVAHILENMKKALKKKESPYAFLLEVLCAMNRQEVLNSTN